MGMDVFGAKPTEKKGEYFRNNVWWWRPLWDYASQVAEDIINEELADGGHYNDGQGLDAVGATALGYRLLLEIESGRCAEHEAEYRKALSEIPMEDCELCGATGIRTDKVGMEAGMHEKALEEAVAIVVGREFGWCNACNGLGKREPWAASYPFSVENVREFAEFCLASGGFSIC